MKKLFWLHALLLALLVGGCGGSVTRVEPFVAQAVVVFGDELSLLSGPDSYRYGVNVLDTTTTPIKPNCSLNPVWSQVVASNFGFGLPGCTVGATATVLAQPGATVAGVATQIQNYTGGFTNKTLITVMAGMHDIVKAYTDCNVSGDAAGAVEQVKAAGAQLGNLINSMAANGVGGRVVFVTVPDPLLSPQGRGISNAGVGLGRCVTTVPTVTRFGKDLNSCNGKGLACSFNTALRTTVVNDGRYVAIVTADELANLMTTVPGNYGLANVTDPACDPAQSDMNANPAQFCTTSTLVAGAAVNPTLYMWADNLRPGPTLHNRIGAAAVTRARNNPF